jgi:predicted metal-dependent hydrolase
LRLIASRAVIVTLPQRGNIQYARQFVHHRKPWLETQWEKLKERHAPSRGPLLPGTPILLHGTPVQIQSLQRENGWEIQLGTASFIIPSPGGELRDAVETFLKKQAAIELPARVDELAKQWGATLRRVTIRSQKTRWGSCSRRGTISLNWRLIQTPDSVRDYIILHELAHLRELNHSPKFWAEVERICPEYRQAEAWIKTQSAQIAF